MKYISLILYYAIISTIVSSTKPKICVDCKFFKGDFFGNTFGKCEKFPIYKYDDDSFLVDGIKKKVRIVYNYCSISRSSSDMCGKEGKFYEKK